MPKVSVIIPCYNQAKYIEEAINSALNQTYKNLEIICVNDKSTDNTSEVIQSFTKKYNNILFIENQENKGVTYSRNLAIDACNGDYILPLDADDTIEPTYIKKAVDVLAKNPQIGIVYCKAKMFGAKNKPWNLPTFNKSDFLVNNCIFCSALFRKSDFIKAGKYKPYMSLGWEDYDLWLSFIEQGLGVYRIEETLFNYRQHKKGARSELCNKNTTKLWQLILTNHLELYIHDKKFIENVIYNNSYKNKKNILKYKIFCYILLIIAIIEAIFIVGL